MNKRLKKNKELLAERVKNMSLVDLEGRNEEEINAIQQLIAIKKYAGGFGLDGEPLPATHLITHKINMSTNKPIKAKQYSYPLKLKEQLQKEIDKLMEGNIIEAAASQYYSPTWIVPKHADKDGNKRWRLLTDFRQLNEITLGSCHPPPFTNDIIEKLVASNYISIMDLKMRFFHIKMNPESPHLTASTGPRGSFQYKRIAMGLKESPITFMKVMKLAIACIIVISWYSQKSSKNT
jgi:hypothetical protein